jgi:hypothetical protein
MIARLQAWGAAAVAAVLAILTVFGIGRLAGSRRAKKEAADRVDQEEARARTAAAEREAADAQIRGEVETDVLRLPTGIDSRVANAVPGTAAEQLRDQWSRD